MLTTIKLPSLMSTKEALVNVATESGWFHISWLTSDDKVIAVEDIAENYPTGGIMVFDSLDEYTKNIRKVHWVNDTDYIRSYSPEMAARSFPFCTDDEKECMERERK